MKKLLMFTWILVGVAGVVMAADFAPKAINLYNVTKRQKMSVKGMGVVTVLPSKATSVYLNGTGNDWTVAANAERDFFIFRNISTLAFTNASTAAADPNKIRVMVP